MHLYILRMIGKFRESRSICPVIEVKKEIMYKGIPLPSSIAIQDGPKGRGLIATRDLPAGTTVLKSEPYSYAVTPSSHQTVCAYCLQKLG